LRVIRLDQADLPGAVPLLDLALTPKRDLTPVVDLVPDEAIDSILGRESPKDLFLVFPNPRADVVCVSAVERSVGGLARR
jgi:hypothetical protein